ncbi:MAG TPA: UMP kinase [Patescibacteria group bacterium]|nr:UMP kinase [Patescibacteria group bacterium]
MYQRVLLKISGEQLGGGHHQLGLDPQVIHYWATECDKVVKAGCKLIIVVGGGNMVRGAAVAGDGIRRVTADHMGMLSGVMNAMAMTDIFESEGVVTRCMSNFFAPQATESYTYRLAEKHLERRRVVIIGGGTARPYVTNDTAAVNFALELGCEVVFKATKVDGVYDKDPTQFDDAQKYDHLDYKTALDNPEIKVMDKTALALAMEFNMPIMVYKAMEPGALLAAVNKQPVGTFVSANA